MATPRSVRKASPEFPWHFPQTREYPPGGSICADPVPGRCALRRGGGQHRIDELAEAVVDGTRREFMETPTTVPPLIIDDLGMRKLPLTAAEDLLEGIMRRYKRASTLLTSNRPVED